MFKKSKDSKKAKIDEMNDIDLTNKESNNYQNLNYKLFQIPNDCYKLAVIGEHGCGKTTFLNQYLFNQYFDKEEFEAAVKFIEFKNYQKTKENQSENNDNVLLNIMQSIIFQMPVDVNKGLNKVIFIFLIVFGFLCLMLWLIFQLPNIPTFGFVIFIIFLMSLSIIIFWKLLNKDKKNIVLNNYISLNLNVSINNDLFTIEKDSNLNNTFYRILKFISYKIILSNYEYIIIEDLDRFDGETAKQIIDFFDEIINFVKTSVPGKKITFIFSFKTELFQLQELLKKFDYHWEMIPYITIENFFIAIQNIINELNLVVTNADIASIYFTIRGKELSEIVDFKTILGDGRFVNALKNECIRLKEIVEQFTDPFDDSIILQNAFCHLLSLVNSNYKINVEYFFGVENLYSIMNSDKANQMQFKNVLKLISGDESADILFEMSPETIQAFKVINLQYIYLKPWSMEYLEGLEEECDELKFIFEISYENLNLFLAHPEINALRKGTIIYERVCNVIKFKYKRQRPYNLPFYDVVTDETYEFYQELLDNNTNVNILNKIDLEKWKSIKFPIDNKLLDVQKGHFNHVLQVIIERNDIETLNLFINNYYCSLEEEWLKLSETQASTIIDLVKDRVFVNNEYDEKESLSNLFLDIPNILKILNDNPIKLNHEEDKKIKEIYIKSIIQLDTLPVNLRDYCNNRGIKILDDDIDKKHLNLCKEKIKSQKEDINKWFCFLSDKKYQ